jgi:hypothetical protein
MVTTGRLAALAAFCVLALLVPSAHAIPPDPGDLPPCLHKFSVPSFGVTPGRVDLGESATLAWRIVVPRECRNQLSFTLNGQSISVEGSRRLTPMANTKFTLQVRGPGGLPRTIDTATLTVDLPHEVTIDRDDQQPLLQQAVGTPATTVRVANHVRLDLSGYENIPVAPGVQLLGGRTPRTAGGLLYTTTRPKRLLVVAGDGVRISGLRISGPDMGVADGDGGPASGIYIRSRNDVEIDHNEISGWKNSAVGVNDDDDRISYVLNPETVRIHDNFIHHNQRTGGFGYGVVIGDGAYALIDRNVFDYNRHAIAHRGREAAPPPSACESPCRVRGGGGRRHRAAADGEVVPLRGKRRPRKGAAQRV